MLPRRLRTLLPLVLVTSVLLVLAWLHRPYIRMGAWQSTEAVPARADAAAAPTELHAYLAWAKQYALHTPSSPHVVLIMGNMAGDLDSSASAIGLSYLLNHAQSYFTAAYGVPRGVYVPLVQTARGDLRQRRENLLVYEMVGAPAADLLCVDELGDLAAAARRMSLGLVDHPVLGEEWGTQGRVVTIVDHHEDEGAHQDAPLRVIRSPSTHLVGSATSLVAQLYAAARADMPVSIADLLLSGLVLDTRNVRRSGRTLTQLKRAPAGKATADDVEAYRYLWPRSSLRDAASADMFLARARALAPDTEPRAPSSAGTGDGTTAAWDALLQAVKADVAHLDTHELLTRDYKVAVVTVPGTSGNTVIHMGISAVPVSLSAWLSNAYRTRAALGTVSEAEAAREWDAWWRALHAWMRERRLDLAVIMTSFREDDGKGHSKSRRDLAIACADEHNAARVDRVARTLVAYGDSFEPHAPKLELAPWKGVRRVASGKRERVAGLQVDAARDVLAGAVRAVPGMHAAVLRQGNTNANRKIVQPALVRVLQHVW